MSPYRAAHPAGSAGVARIVFGPRTAYRTPAGRAQEDGQPGSLRPLVGHSLLNFDGMRPGMIVHIDAHIVETWAEAYRPLDAHVLKSYADGPLAGEAAVVRQGNAVSIGAWSASLVTEVLAGVLAEAGIPVVPLPEGVRVSRRGALQISTRNRRN